MLKLMAADELVALENTNLLRQRGYEVALKDDGPAGRRLSHRLSRRQSAYRF
ncbi:hypothetical protein BJY52DRAFT_1248685 [Lactarius psammicola]|nr:hypothetical protein BJY52DRAFT_1248685 [Lactarius psammicola]